MLVRTLSGVALLAVLCSCAPRATGPERPWRDFVSDLTNTLRLVDRNTGGTRLISTADPRGGNDDFNQFHGPGAEPGWVTLADLKGPGVVRRFWTTGVDPGHPFRLYFDGEKHPRLEGAIDELFGGRAPFAPPLARYMNLCWFSYVPYTYRRSLRIESKAPPTHPLWGPRRFFFQLNVEDLPAGARVESFPMALSDADRAACDAVAAAWNGAVRDPLVPDGEQESQTLLPGEEKTVWRARGPAILPVWQLAVAPARADEWSIRERENLLQDVVLKIRYNGRADASVDAPLGDFFGNAWRRREYGSLMAGVGPDLHVSRWPLAFAESAEIVLVNGSDRAIHARFGGAARPVPDAGIRYFHAEWRRSGPEAGRPHPIAAFAGRGLFAGAFLGVTGVAGTPQDDSWWLLEGDEAIEVDDEARPSWRGTGLEDYFNGGWYYRSCAFSGLHGIFDRSPFRVAQYRHQLVDPVAFDRSLRMSIERGDQNVSRAWFQSVAYAYLDEPAAVQPTPARREDRRAVEHRLEWQNLMLQLTELERMNNFRAALALIGEYREAVPDAPDHGVYALRALEYRRLLGESIGAAELAPFVAGGHGPAAAEQARLLEWFYAAPNRALAGINANAQAQLYLNGRALARTEHPLAWAVVGVELGAGPIALCADATMIRQEPWVNLGLRSHTGFAGSGIGTKRARRVSGVWNGVEASATEWAPAPNPDLLRGTPDAPFIGSIANAFVLFGSKSFSVRSEDWAHHKGRGYFRLDLPRPPVGWPDQAAEITGLGR